MKRRVFYCFALLLPLLGFVAGCSDGDDEKKADQVSIADGVTEIVFTPENKEPQTLTIDANTTWSIALSQTGWATVTPAGGSAGKTTVTVRLLDINPSKEERETTATITAGTAIVTFRIVQQVPPPPTGIQIVAPQKRLTIGKTMPLTIEMTPANAGARDTEWSSSDEAVLTVDAEGKATAVAVGTAVVKAKMDNLTAECELEVTEVFTTDGAGRSYTFKQLSENALSGVEVRGGAYVVTTDFVVAETDVLVLGDSEQVKIGNEVEITILGKVDFTPEKTAAIMADEGAAPDPIYFTGDVEGGGEISNVNFTGCAIRYYGKSTPMTITKCEFKNITISKSAISIGSGKQLTVTDCRFVDNAYPAFEIGANTPTPVVFNNNYLYKNSATARNKPQINATVGGDGKVEIKGNTVIGPGEFTTCGGIAVGNMFSLPGTNEVLIEGNKVSDCRYGITTLGAMTVRIIDNELLNNKWDSNPMSGGSGISVTDPGSTQKLYIRGNKITGHLWGITLIGSVKTGKGPEANLGNATQGDNYNPGGNVFKDNGNGGKLYDLYNNSPITVYAQGNTWNVATQDQASIETVITHKTDDATLGEVIFMPAAK